MFRRKWRSGGQWLVLGLAVWLAALISGCTTRMSADERVASQEGPPGEPIVLRVSGYAALSLSADQSTLGDRLLAMRASKLDAYRALAEQLYGTAVFGDSTVDGLHLHSDRFKTLIDTSIRGARVVDVRELQGGGYETVLELQLDAHFSYCLSLVNQFRFDEECRPPLPMGSDISASGPAPGRQPPVMYSIAADAPKGE